MILSNPPHIHLLIRLIAGYFQLSLRQWLNGKHACCGHVTTWLQVWMNEAVTGKSVQICENLSPQNHSWKQMERHQSTSCGGVIYGVIFHLTVSSLTLFFSNNPFGSQTGIPPFLQPPPYLRPMSYKLLCGLFRGITRLRIEDNSKEKIQRELTQHNRDQMWLFGSCKAGSWNGGLERMLYSHHNYAFIGRKWPGIFSWHICDLGCDWSMSHWDSLQWTKLFTDLHCSRPLYLDIDKPLISA